MDELATIELDMIDAEVVYRAPYRHIYLGATGDKERWIDTHKDGVASEFNRGQLIVTAPRAYLAAKGLV